MMTLSKKEEIILALLLKHDQLYGLDMVARSRDLKRGTVYVTLDRMEDKGLISSKEVQPPKGSRGPARRVYSVTGAGQRVFSAWQMYRAKIVGLGLQGG